MRLTLRIVELHILDRSKGALDDHVEALVARVGDGDARGHGGYVGFSILYHMVVS